MPKNEGLVSIEYEDNVNIKCWCLAWEGPYQWAVFIKKMKRGPIIRGLEAHNREPTRSFSQYNDYSFFKYLNTLFVFSLYP